MYIVIAGAGLVGCGLAKALVASRHDVVVVDPDKSVCEWVASHLGALALNGSATNIEILEQAGIEKADVAVATMRSSPGIRPRYFSCSTRISFSTSWGEAPGQVVRMETTRASRSGIICTGTLKTDRIPNRVRIRMPTAG